MQYRELRTYTSLWGMEKRLYKFYDINLPYPISVRQIGIFLGTLIPWVFLLSVIGLPFSNPWYVVWIVPPFVIAYYGNRPVAEGKQLADYIFSQASYFTRGKKFNGLKPAVGDSRTKETYDVKCLVWTENETRKKNRRKAEKKENQKKSKGNKKSRNTETRKTGNPKGKKNHNKGGGTNRNSARGGGSKGNSRGGRQMSGGSKSRNSGGGSRRTKSVQRSH